MNITICVYKTMASYKKTSFGVLLGIKFCYGCRVAVYIGNKRNIVCFCHWVVKAYIIFNFHFFSLYNMAFITVFGFQWRKRYSTAAKRAFAKGIYNISAYGAYIKFSFKLVAGFISVCNWIAGNKLRYGNIKRF